MGYSFGLLQEYAGSIVNEETVSIILRRGKATLTLRDHRFIVNSKETGETRVIVVPYMVQNKDYGSNLPLGGFGSNSHLDLQDAAKNMIDDYLERYSLSKIYHDCRNGVPESFVIAGL